MNLYVSNLGDQITDESLRCVFATHGWVSSSKVMRDDSTGYSRGTGFVSMPNEKEAQTALEKINGMVVNGKRIAVKIGPVPAQTGKRIGLLRN